MRRSIPVLAAFALLSTLSITPAASAQTQLVGEWSASFTNDNGQTLHLLWHVTKASDGSVSATFDNVDEGVSGIKVKTLTLEGSQVTAIIDDVIHPNGQDLPLAGTYTGKLNKDGTEVSGNWTQSKPEEQPPLELTFKREQAAPPAAAPQL